jgi:hypothetical protein
MIKISDWSNTIYLFTNEHPVPGLPPQIAAIFGTTFELSCPILLTLGLATRLATLPLLVMTAVINFTYDNATEHYYWAMLLGILLVNGAGRLSLDFVIACKKGLAPAPATAEGAVCSTGFNYCFWAKLLVAIPALPLIAIMSASFFHDSTTRGFVAVIAVIAAVWAAIKIDTMPCFSGMVRKNNDKK